MSRRLPFTIAAVLVTAFIVTSYLVFRQFGYVTAPGGDLYNHAQMVFDLQRQGASIFFSGYPKLFHTVVLAGVDLLHHDPLKIMLLYLPIVIALAGLSAFLLLNRLRGPWAGLLGLVLVMFVAIQPLQTLYDGGFPNFISVSVWLPIVLLGIADLDAGGRYNARGISLTFLGAVLIVLTHHFSALYLVILLVASAFFSTKTVRWYLLSAFVIGLVILLSPVASGARNLLSSVIQFGGMFPWVHIVGQIDNPNAIINITSYGDYFGPFIYFAGLLTMGGVILAWIRKIRIPLPISLLTVLGIVLLICSQIEAFRFPLRLARDAGVPLTLLTAYGVSIVLYAVKPNRVLTNGFAIVLVLAMLPALITRFDRLFTFEPDMQYTPAQAAMAARAQGAPAIFVNQLLVSIAFPNVKPIFPDQQSDTLLAPLITSERLVLLNVNDPNFRKYEKVLAVAQYSFIAEDSDPLNRVRFYAR